MIVILKRLDRLTDGGLELHLNMKIPPLQDVQHLETEQGPGPQSDGDHKHPQMFSFIPKQTNLHQYHSEQWIQRLDSFGFGASLIHM